MGAQDGPGISRAALSLLEKGSDAIIRLGGIVTRAQIRAPEGRPTLAQRFSAGKGGDNDSSPEGRLRTLNCGPVSVVPPALEPIFVGDPTSELVGYCRWSLRDRMESMSLKFCSARITEFSRTLMLRIAILQGDPPECMDHF